jgi:two-component system cell cycle sensor histidine kinase/response regulator CckA
VAHDFNNLLGAIIGYTDMLIDRMGPDEPWRGPMQEVLKAAERAAVLTRQLLVFSRKDVLSRDVLDLGEIVDGVHKLLRRLIGEDIEMVTVVDPAVGRVEADPGQIEQVLLNLAVNARDAMPCGGKLTIRIENVDPDGASAAGHADVRPGSYVMLTVSDTGCGMDAETQSHIFEPFFTTKERDKGTGLGLATVYAIVGQSEGHIRVDSRPDHGTTFRIYLPRTTEEIRPGPAPDTSAASGGGTETILVAEDEPIVRELVHTVLGMRGYTVLEAIQGDEALRLCEQHPGRIDLLLTDVVMPGMSGRELVTRVVEVRPGIKVLYMSGYTDDAVLRHGVANAQAAFLQKPFTPQVLGGKVRDVLDSK